jgi:phosphate transport system substrate-binding protein
MRCLLRKPDHLMADLAHPKLVFAIVAAIIAVLAIWISTALSRWRRVTWRDHIDTKISALPMEARESGPWAVWRVLTHHEEVAQPTLVLLRIRNSGLRSISPADVRQPLTFTFPGRVVKEFTVTDCRSVSRQEIQPPGDLSLPPPVENMISLPSFPLKRKAGFKLLVLLSGAGREVIVKGRLRRGSVLHESRIRGPVAQNIVFGSVLLLLVGIQAGITFGQGSTLPSYCASGKLALEGSTAFTPTAQQVASSYTSVCPGAAISVNGIATFNGLNAVAAQGNAGQSEATAAGATQVAMSDGPAPADYPTLVGRPVAVILFAVVVNKKTNVYNLTTAQLRDIFQGRITNWKQVGGLDQPISIVARTTGSGTRATFDQKILGGQEPPISSYNCTDKDAVPTSKVLRCEVSATTTLLQDVNAIPSAIGYAQVSDASSYPDVSPIKINGWDSTINAVELNDYAFWTVEYLYTYGTPATGSLAADFLSYMNSITSDDILRSEDYTPCRDRGQSQPLCSRDLAGNGSS